MILFDYFNIVILKIKNIILIYFKKKTLNKNFVSKGILIYLTIHVCTSSDYQCVWLESITALFQRYNTL